MKSLALMYHDVYDRATPPGIASTATTYHISREAFAAQLETIAGSGLHVVSVGESLRQPAAGADRVTLTFDDGWLGAFELAVPLLLERGWTATFYVTRDFIGRAHFCQRSTLQAAAAAGMEIGVHGVTHRMLSSCSRVEAVAEFQHCREYLESLLGKAVEHASIPGGDFTAMVVSCAREAGMISLANSRPGINSPTSGRFDLRRIGIKQSTSMTDVERFCRFDIRRERVRWALLQMPRAALGMKRYARLRRLILRTKARNHVEVFEP